MIKPFSQAVSGTSYVHNIEGDNRMPSIEAGEILGSNASMEITGSDHAGQITINISDFDETRDPAEQTLCNITFDAALDEDVIPIVVLYPASNGAAKYNSSVHTDNGLPWVSASNIGFSLIVNDLGGMNFDIGAPSVFNYIVAIP
jgi:hypothetical protein